MKKIKLYCSTAFLKVSGNGNGGEGYHHFPGRLHKRRDKKIGISFPFLLFKSFYSINNRYYINIVNLINSYRKFYSDCELFSNILLVIY